MLLDIESVAEALGISIRQVRRMVAEGRIPHVRIGGLIRFDPDEIIQWIDDRRVGGGTGVSESVRSSGGQHPD